MSDYSPPPFDPEFWGRYQELRETMTNDKQTRKETPIATGCLDYFPDALADVAHVSYVGNQQHNPGQPMHWDRSKSSDHADCLLRHLAERGTLDTDGLRHSAKVAWRALAMLQVEVEGKGPQAVQYVEAVTPVQKPKPPLTFQESDLNFLLAHKCPAPVAAEIVAGITYANTPPNQKHDYVYLAGPMRGLPEFNFPAFDKARDLLVSKGYNVISPADIDRAGSPTANDPSKEDVKDQTKYATRDFYALRFLAHHKQEGWGDGSIVMLEGWQKSTGASAELGIAKWLGLSIRYIEGWF